MNKENILLVEAEEPCKSLLSQLIGRLGYKFRTATDSNEALGCLKNGTFTLVIAAVSLFQPKDILRVQEANPGISFIFTDQSLEKSTGQINPSMSDFLSKPISLEEAEFRLKRMISEWERRSQEGEAQKELQTAKDELERKNRELESSVEDLEHIKHLYKEIGNELNRTSEKLRDANYQLEVLAVTDGLTEVYNHRYFMDKVSEKFDDSKKKSIPLSLLMIDIDHFKALNDNHGHMTGDVVLKDIASILKSSCRKEDIVARYGGEEFAIILPETDSHQAVTIAEKIRTLMEDYRLPNGEGEPRVTVSIGVGTTDKEIDSANALISSADKALYHAKARGRNRVVFGEPNQPMPVQEWFSRF